MLRHRQSETSIGAIFFDPNARQLPRFAGVFSSVRTAGAFKHVVSSGPDANVAGGFDELPDGFARLGDAAVCGRLGFLSLAAASPHS